MLLLDKRLGLKGGAVVAYTRPNPKSPHAGVAIGKSSYVETASSGATTKLSAAASANTNVQEGYLTGMVPDNDRQLVSAYRDMYYNDSICGSAVDLWSELPFSDFQLYGIADERLEVYNSALARLNLRSACSMMTRQYLVEGSYTSTLVFDQKTTQFVDQVPYAYEDLTFDESPLLSQDPVITAKVNKRFDLFLNDNSPEWANLRKAVPPALIQALKSGEFVLDPLSTLHLARRSFPSEKPTSYLKRCLPIYMLEKVLYRGTLFELSRRQRANVLVTAGDDMWEPTVEELSALANLFQQSDLDPMGALIVTRNAVNVQEFRAGGDFVKWTDVYDQTTAMKLKSLGISDAFLSSDACLAGDTLIPTNKGLLRIDEIIPDAASLPKNKLVPVSATVKSRFGKQGKVHSGLYNGDRYARHIHLGTGAVLKATDNHPVLVFDGIKSDWKRVDQLEVGDLLCVDCKPIISTHKLSIPPLEMKCKRSTPVKQPEYMSTDLAYVMGALFADGWVNKKQVGFSNTNLNLVRKVQSLWKSLFGLDVTIYEKPAGLYTCYGHEGQSKPLYTVVVTSKHLSSLMHHLGFTIHNKGAKNCGERDIPWSVRKANSACHAAFLAGYMDGDGHVAKGKCALLSISEKLRNGIYNLLNGLGVFSQIKGNAVTVTASEYVNRLYSYVEPYMVKDVEYVEEANSFKTDCLDVRGYFDVVRNLIVGYNRYGYITVFDTVVSANAIFQKYGVNIGELVRGNHKSIPYNDAQKAKGVYHFLKHFDTDLAEAFKREYKNGYILVSVQAIKKGIKERVYDISMHGEPAFVAQGVVVHNTFANANQAVEVFMDNLSAYRSHFTHTVFTNKLFPLIAMAKGFNKETSKEEANGLSIKKVNDYSQLDIPKVRWAKRISATNDENLMESLTALSEKGVPIPMRLWIAASGQDPSALLAELEDDANFKKELDKYGPETDEDDPLAGLELSSLSSLPTKSSGFRNLVKSGMLSDAVRIAPDGKVHHVYNQTAAHKDINYKIAKAIVEREKKGQK